MKKHLISKNVIEKRIFLIRGQEVMLSTHLAELYDVEPRTLMQAVKRNKERFPVDFMFQLNNKETANLKSQIVISSWGGRRIKPYAFTEQGVAMLSSVLRSKRAVQINIDIMRAFARLRHLLLSTAELRRRIEGLAEVCDAQFAIVFDELRRLKVVRRRKKRPIGFRPPEKKQ